MQMRSNCNGHVKWVLECSAVLLTFIEKYARVTVGRAVYPIICKKFKAVLNALAHEP